MEEPHLQSFNWKGLPCGFLHRTRQSCFQMRHKMCHYANDLRLDKKGTFTPHVHQQKSRTHFVVSAEARRVLLTAATPCEGATSSNVSRFLSLCGFLERMTQSPFQKRHKTCHYANDLHLDKTAQKRERKRKSELHPRDQPKSRTHVVVSAEARRVLLTAATPCEGAMSSNVSRFLSLCGFLERMTHSPFQMRHKTCHYANDLHLDKKQKKKKKKKEKAKGNKQNKRSISTVESKRGEVDLA